MNKGKILHLLRSLFTRKKKDYVPVYLSRFETIEKYIKSRLIGIDVKECYVILDVSVHICYMNKDKEYSAFFDSIRAFINYYRGLFDIPMVEYNDRINFSVNFKREIRIDIEKEEFYDKPIEENIPWLIGYYQSGNIVYTTYNINEK